MGIVVIQIPETTAPALAPVIPVPLPASLYVGTYAGANLHCLNNGAPESPRLACEWKCVIDWTRNPVKCTFWSWPWQWPYCRDVISPHGQSEVRNAPHTDWDLRPQLSNQRFRRRAQVFIVWGDRYAKCTTWASCFTAVPQRRIFGCEVVLPATRISDSKRAWLFAMVTP